MRKRCSFQENTIHNFQIEEEFDQIMQIEGLGSKGGEKKELFVSIKHLFRPQTAVNVIGQGPNANIKSFYYLLLCHIRKEHYKKLVADFKQKQFQNQHQDEDCFKGRDRRVSFNDKRALFLDGPQYENYCLHKLKIFAFSRQADFLIIKNSPFETQPTLRFKGEKLSSLMMKKLLSQFLKELLPTTLNPNYKQEMKSIKFYLNKHKSIGIIFTILMRYILLSKYQVESARDFKEQVNDHTVCTTLCDAFAIDGLLCKENLYEINTWCKVHSLQQNGKKTFFIEMFNDQFQEMGTSNQRRNTISSCKMPEKDTGVISNLMSSEQQGKSAAFGRNSSESSSMMGADEESQVASSAVEWHKVENNIRAVESESFRSQKQRSSSLNNNTFRETFNSNRQAVQQTLLAELQKQDDDNSSSQNRYQQQQLVKQDEDCPLPCFTQQKVGQKRQAAKPQVNININENVRQAEQDKGKAKFGDQGQPNIVNNNISNNIYVNIGNKPYMVPVINILTRKEFDAASDSYIKINLS